MIKNQGLIKINLKARVIFSRSASLGSEAVADKDASEAKRPRSEHINRYVLGSEAEKRAAVSSVG